MDDLYPVSTRGRATWQSDAERHSDHGRPPWKRPIGIALAIAVGLAADIGFWNLSMLRMMQAIRLPFVFIPLSAVSYVGVPPDRTNDASATINLIRNLGRSIGVSLSTTMLQERLQFHHERLAEHITAYNGYGWPTPLAPLLPRLPKGAVPTH
jgi:hypothetical protein